MLSLFYMRPVKRKRLNPVNDFSETDEGYSYISHRLIWNLYLCFKNSPFPITERVSRDFIKKQNKTKKRWGAKKKIVSFNLNYNWYFTIHVLITKHNKIWHFLLSEDLWRLSFLIYLNSRIEKNKLQKTSAIYWRHVNYLLPKDNAN